MYYGVAYYPEQKTPEELEHDIHLLIESNINTVRMGEFAWCRMEPEEGVYSFGWLADAVNKLGEHGIFTILCTPTACPPAWLVEKEPDSFYMDNRRIRRPYGGRRDYCYNHEAYRRYSVKIAEELSRYFQGNPYVAGYQIDNEPAQEGTGRCCCPVCEAKFQKWLEKKYKTIGEYNRRSGSVFWSQEYSDFSQIKPPVNSIEVGTVQQIKAFHENPTLRLEFERFCSESQIEYQNLQVEALRKYTDKPITTNGTGLATNSINYYESFRELDAYAFDYYPDLRNKTVDSFPYAFGRGVKDGKPFWILEFMSGGGHKLGGSGRKQTYPGALKQAAVQAFAHGAEMMLHFQFRTFPYGAEQLNYAIVDMDGVPRRRYFEMQETAGVLKKLEALQDTSFCGEVAIVFDYDSLWAMNIKPANSQELCYWEYCRKFYKTAQSLGVNADVIDLTHDFSRYKVLILPAAFVLSEASAMKIKTYVKNGGTVVATFLTGVKNPDNAGYTCSLPAHMTDLFGVVVEEVEPVFADNTTKFSLEAEEGRIVTSDHIWSEMLGGTAHMAGRYCEDYKDGAGVISHHHYGTGESWYLGTDLEDAVLKKLLKTILAEAGVFCSPWKWSDQVETVTRMDEDHIYTFLFNFSNEAVAVPVQKAAVHYMTGRPYQPGEMLERQGFMVLEEKR